MRSMQLMYTFFSLQMSKFVICWCLKNIQKFSTWFSFLLRPFLLSKRIVKNPTISFKKKKNSFYNMDSVAWSTHFWLFSFSMNLYPSSFWLTVEYIIISIYRCFTANPIINLFHSLMTFTPLDYLFNYFHYGHN